MILKSITLNHFGPFGTDAKLIVDPEVTVLTGANDSGKSLALRGIEILCSQSRIESHEVNRDRTGEFEGKWSEDQEVTCTGVFEATDTSRKRRKLPKETTPGSTVTVNRMMAGQFGTITEIKSEKTRMNPQGQFNDPPTILRLPLSSKVRQEISLDKMTEAETHLLRLGFGSAFSAKQHQGFSQVERAFRVRQAEANLNARLERILPTAMPMSFMVTEVSGEANILGIGLVDHHGGFAPLGSRGSGVRKLLDVMGALLRLDPDDGHSIVLFDEPETSLHADAQHKLRHLLEGLAEHPNVQVVYSTHSPAMINSLRPQSIRVLERRREKERAISVFANESFGENFQLVRSSLGISPADSLLYAPITVVVEGKSEVMGIPAILDKLAKENIIDADKLRALLSHTHILDGEGSSFERICKMAISQRAVPVVFLDGDKAKAKEDLKKELPDVEVVILDGGKEIEDLIPKSVYFQAIAELLGEHGSDATESNFDAWADEKGPTASKKMFSKQVDWWLYEIGVDWKPPKHIALLKAIELADPGDITAGPFKELLEAMARVGAFL